MRCRVRITSVVVKSARVARGGSIPRRRRFGDAPDAIARRIAAPRRRSPDGARSLPRAWAIREVASGRRRRTSARIPSGRRRRTSARIPRAVPWVPRMVPRVVPRVPPALRSNAASRPSLRRCASSTVSGRGHVVQAPRASVIAAKRPVERIANSLDVGDQRRGGSRARLVPHHARVHVRVPLVSRRGRVGHDAELMGSLGNATGAIEGSKHWLHATRAGTVRRGRNRAPGEFGDLVLSTSDADADDGAARGSERVQGVLRVAGDARGVRGGGGGVRGTVGARRAQLLHLRAREEDGRRVLERRGTRTIVRGVRVPRGGSSARVRRETWVVRAAGMRSRVTAGGARARTVARERRVSREIGASTRRVGRARAAGVSAIVPSVRRRVAGRWGASGPSAASAVVAPTAATTAPAVAIATTACAASAVARVAGALATLVVRGRSTARRGSTSLVLAAAAAARATRAFWSTVRIVVVVVVVDDVDGCASSRETVGVVVRAGVGVERGGVVEAVPEGRTLAQKVIGHARVHVPPRVRGVHGRQRRVALGGISTSRVIIRARGIGEPVARVVAHLQRARPHQATLSDPRSVRRTLPFDDTERRARDQWRRRAPGGRPHAASSRPIGRSDAEARRSPRQTHYHGCQVGSGGKLRGFESTSAGGEGSRVSRLLANPHDTNVRTPRVSSEHLRCVRVRLVRTSPFRPRFP